MNIFELRKLAKDDQATSIDITTLAFVVMRIMEKAMSRRTPPFCGNISL